MTDKFDNKDEIRNELLKKLINENKKIDRSERSKTINTKTSNKIIKDLLEKLDWELKQ